jgi:hypothetical protein
MVRQSGLSQNEGDNVLACKKLYFIELLGFQEVSLGDGMVLGKLAS